MRLPNLCMTIEALAGKPIEFLSALWALPCARLFLNPSLDSMLLHVLQLLNHMFMVGDTIDDVSVPEVPQPLTGKLGTIKTPGYVFFRGTLTKSMPALHAVRRYPLRETAVAANPFDGNPFFPGELLQLLSIVY